MKNGFLTIFLLIKLCHEIKSQSNYKYLNINDEYTYFIYSNDANLGVYLGNELIFLNISYNSTGCSNIQINNNSISFIYDNRTSNASDISFSFNETKVYYLRDRRFLFVNETNTIEFKFSENLVIINSAEFKGIKHNIISSNGEYFFIDNYSFAFFLLIFGCLIASYGAYHFMLGIVIHSFFLFYFLITDFINFFSECEKFIVYISFGLLLVSITISIFLKPKNEKLNEEELKIKNEENLNEGLLEINLDAQDNSKQKKSIKLYFLNGLYGASFGFALFKTFIYYYIYFELPFSFIPLSYRFEIYYFVISLIFIAAGIFLNLFDFLNKYRYLPCSAIAGSFYIIKATEYIIGGYYSSILFYKLDLKFKNKDKLKTALTYFIFHMAIIIYSIIFQIYYIRLKENSFPSSSVSNRDSDVNSSKRNTNNEINNSKNIDLKEEDEALLENKVQDASSLNDNEEIDDQED